MAKAGERTYFKEIGEAGISFTLEKPFSDPVNVGSLLSDIAAVFSLLPKPPAKIIDLGCGSGWTSNFYALGGYDVTGVDISSDAVEAAEKRFVRPNLSLKYVHGDYDTLPYSDDFDAAVFFDSLHHAEDEVAALTAAYKALKPGGTIVLCEPGVGHSKSPSSIEAVKKYGVNERDMPPTLSRKALKKVGFKDIKTFPYPALLHRANYKEFSGRKRILNTLPGRQLTSFILGSIFLRNHGIVTARKP